MEKKKLIIIIAVLATIFTLLAIAYYYYRKVQEERIICDIAHTPNDFEVLTRGIYKGAESGAGAAVKA